MTAERDLQRLLASLQPEQRPGAFVLVTVPQDEPVPPVTLAASVTEDEGLTVVTTRDDADGLGLAYDFVGAWITLRVHSALDAVGLTAVVSTALAGEGISCNVLAGFHHDHLLVPIDRAEDALRVLRALAPR